jgi:ketosteroid isomerase-like protein
MQTSAEGTFHEATSAWLRALADKKPAKIAACFAEDALAMYPVPHPTIGRAANQAAWASYFDRYAVHPVSIDTIVLAESGEVGYILGRHANAETAGPGAEAGRFVAMWRYRAGQWEIAVLSAQVHTDVAPFSFADV